MKNVALNTGSSHRKTTPGGVCVGVGRKLAPAERRALVAAKKKRKVARRAPGPVLVETTGRTNAELLAIALTTRFAMMMEQERIMADVLGTCLGKFLVDLSKEATTRTINSERAVKGDIDAVAAVTAHKILAEILGIMEAPEHLVWAKSVSKKDRLRLARKKLLAAKRLLKTVERVIRDEFPEVLSQVQEPMPPSCCHF